MSLPKTRTGRISSKRLGLLVLTPMVAAMTALSAQAASTAPKITATIKYDKKSGQIIAAGKATGVSEGALVTFYNAADHSILYTTKVNSKLAFSQVLPAAAINNVCAVQVEAGGIEAAVVVSGTATASSCAAVPSCMIKEGNQSLTSGDHGMLTAVATNKKSKAALTYNWTVSDGSAALNGTIAQGISEPAGAMMHHHFPNPGLYRVDLKGSSSSGTCADSVLVSVAPKNGNPNPKVAEKPAAVVGEAVKAANGSYVVLPFEETGMQGGSQIHLPYDAMIPYNALNAQVVKKVPQRPQVVGSSDLGVFYSAGSNPNDPLGAGSINSTSQNWFSDGGIGANVDLAKTTIDSKTQKPTSNVFIQGHDYQDAVVRKTEQWDRAYQPTAEKLGIAQTGTSNMDNQIGLRFIPAKPMAKPDQGTYGYVDNAAGVRAMPGISDPYKVNIPQEIPFNADQNSFTAQFIPATDVDDKGKTNPYPVFRVEAKDKAGATVAKTDAVYTTASETRCRECHTPGGIAADDNVWRTPVNEAELKNPDGTPGPATGAGSFDPGLDPTKPWPPAIHNRFDDKYQDNPTFTNLDATAKAAIPLDQNGLRTDRVKASRWAEFGADGKPTGKVQDTRPADATNWKLQIQVKFKTAADYGGDSWVEQEKAALFNTLVMHDYMVFYGPTPAVGKDWPAKPSSQLADSFADDVGLSRVQPMYYCSGHHQSQLKFDFGIAAKSPATNRSDYSRAFHAFHGKMQVYKADVAKGADGLPHKKGELIRDERGHPVMFGGRGWDSQKDDDNGIPLKMQANGTFATESVKGTDPAKWDATKFTVPTWDPAKNNWRPDLWPKRADGDFMLPVGDKVAMEDNCVKCHTGKTEKSYRDVHHAAGLKCDNCHGDMLAVGNAYGNEGYDANLTWAGAFGKDTHGNCKTDDVASCDPADFRRPWLDEPDCGSCHMGDAARGDFSAGTMKQAWNPGDKSGMSRMAPDARFAVMPHKEHRPELATVNGVSTFVKQPLSQALYRKSYDVHSIGANQVTCSTCHGGSHALWPNPDPNANDNLTSKQLQGYDGNILECSVCHVKDDFKTGLIATDGGTSGLGVAQGVRDGAVVAPTTSGKAFLAGPHGMHPVADEYFWKDAAGAGLHNSYTGKIGNGGWHADMAKKPGPDGEDQCAACHGADHKGTRLSKTLVKRTFLTDKGKTVTVEAGQTFGCDLCHSMAVSFAGAPNPKAADGGWPKAKMHMPAMPESITPGAQTGGGGMGH